MTDWSKYTPSVEQPLDRDDAERGYEASLDMLEGLEKIGPDVRPVESLVGMRVQLVYNMATLINGSWYPMSAGPQEDSVTLALTDPAERAVFAEDTTLQRAFAVMDAYDRRDWSTALTEYRALKEPLFEKFAR